jgi:hypothetical protein
VETLVRCRVGAGDHAAPGHFRHLSVSR